MPEYAVVEVKDDPRAYRPVGQILEAWRCKQHEIMLSGPAETGKTRGALEKLDALMWKYPGARALIVRRKYSDLKTSAIKTYEEKVLGAFKNGEFNAKASPVTKFGGENPQHYSYPNGSRVTVSGLDTASGREGGKVLSSEYDVIYINQAEELTLDDYEKITTRCTGRAGNTPYPQIISDCNPGPPSHWILGRERAGSLTVFHTTHKDNPTLWNGTDWTEQGKRTLEILGRLTGARKQRLLYGKWVQSEGVVYDEFSRADHVIRSFEIPRHWRIIRVIDFGFVHPFVCQWWAIDPDGVMFMYREIYMTGRTVREHARIINLISKFPVEATICDHDAEDRKTLEENGIPNIAAYKDVSRGIDAVKERLKANPKLNDKRFDRRIYFFDDALLEVDKTLEEQHRPSDTSQSMEAYIWKDSSTKEEPVKEDDDGADCVRYAVAYVDNLKRRGMRPARRTGSVSYGGNTY